MTNDNQFTRLQKNLENKKSEVLKTINETHKDSLDWLEKKGLDLEKIREKQIGKLAAATATGILLLSPGSIGAKELPGPQTELLSGPGKDVAQLTSINDPGAVIASGLKEKLATSNEKEVEKFVQDTLGIKGVYEQNGYRLNVNIGLIGAEQHLYRWPGDSVDKHSETADDRAMFASSGIANSRGAYGYFGSPNSQEAIQNERYYFATQTFLSPTWGNDTKGTYNFFRFKKLIAINTKDGQAVVGVVGDAGPAQWTGKSYGGSPEIMQSLGLGGGPRKGEILLLLVDDPNDQVPLGPVKLNGGGA